MDPKLENEKGDYYLHLENIIISKGQEAEHLDPEPIIDTVGNVIHFGMKYITGRYLEISNFTNKYHEFEVRRKHIFVQGTTVFFPQVPLMYVSKTGATVKIANDIILELQVRSSLSM